LFSLGEQHAFRSPTSFRYLHPSSVEEILIQAFLDAPVFKTRWAMERHRVARGDAHERRQEGAGAAAADARGRSAGGGVS
jgi:ATP-dependent Lhr-like helicase